jgi:hypothetical protein
VRDRNTRRQLRKKLGVLAEQARVARGRLFSAEASLAELQAAIAAEAQGDAVARSTHESVRASVVDGIEAYVQALAHLVDADDRQASVAYRDDELFLQLLGKSSSRRPRAGASARPTSRCS